MSATSCVYTSRVYFPGRCWPPIAVERTATVKLAGRTTRTTCRVPRIREVGSSAFSPDPSARESLSRIVVVGLYRAALPRDERKTRDIHRGHFYRRDIRSLGKARVRAVEPRHLSRRGVLNWKFVKWRGSAEATARSEVYVGATLPLAVVTQSAEPDPSEMISALRNASLFRSWPRDFHSDSLFSFPPPPARNGDFRNSASRNARARTRADGISRFPRISLDTQFYALPLPACTSREDARENVLAFIKDGETRGGGPRQTCKPRPPLFLVAARRNGKLVARAVGSNKGITGHFRSLRRERALALACAARRFFLVSISIARPLPSSLARS